MNDIRSPLHSVTHRIDVDAVAASLTDNGIPATNSSMGTVLSIQFDFESEETGRKIAHALGEMARQNGFQTHRRGYATYDASGYQPSRHHPNHFHKGSGKVTVYLNDHPSKTITEAATLLTAKETVKLIKQAALPSRPMRTYSELGQNVIRCGA